MVGRATALDLHTGVPEVRTSTSPYVLCTYPAAPGLILLGLHLAPGPTPALHTSRVGTDGHGCGEHGMAHALVRRPFL